MYRLEDVLQTDPEVAKAIQLEIERQRQKIELIASENFVSKAVMAVMGSPLTNKYAEGYPGKRYYGGCEHVDTIEDLARTRAKHIFSADHVNVQPHSGAQANMAVYQAVLKPGDAVLGMNLSEGGHLTHGSPVNASGILYNFTAYGVNDDGFIDYDMVRKAALTYKPKLIVAGASAYPRIIDFTAFRNIADEIGAYLMVDMAHIAGLVAAGVHPSPVPHADFVTTTTHKTLRGPRGGMILCKARFRTLIDKAIFPGSQGGPLMHVIAAKAVCFLEAAQPAFKRYQEAVVYNAKTLAIALMEQGFMLTSGGTDNHLMLVDLRNKDFTGKDAEQALDDVGITVNKNTIPRDPQSPFITSGIRIGTAAVTSKGFSEEDMREIAAIIALTLDRQSADHMQARERVRRLCDKYPLY